MRSVRMLALLHGGLQMSKTITCCGMDLVCSRFTNTCGGCGRDYNFAGQLLAPRSQWGEETGETAADILNHEAAGFPEIDY